MVVIRIKRKELMPDTKGKKNIALGNQVDRETEEEVDASILSMEYGNHNNYVSPFLTTLSCILLSALQN